MCKIIDIFKEPAIASGILWYCVLYDSLIIPELCKTEIWSTQELRS